MLKCLIDKVYANAFIILPLRLSKRFSYFRYHLKASIFRRVGRYAITSSHSVQHNVSCLNTYFSSVKSLLDEIMQENALARFNTELTINSVQISLTTIYAIQIVSIVGLHNRSVIDSVNVGSFILSLIFFSGLGVYQC